MNKAHEIVNKYDKLFNETSDNAQLEKANDEACEFLKKNTDKLLKDVLLVASNHMKLKYFRGDN